VPVVVGTGAQNPRLAAAHAAHARKVGAVGLMVIPRTDRAIPARRFGEPLPDGRNPQYRCSTAPLQPEDRCGGAIDRAILLEWQFDAAAIIPGSKADAVAP